MESESKRSRVISMRLKLFIFLVLLVISMIFGVFVIFTITGTLNTGVRQTQKDVEKGLSHLSQDITQQYGQYSAQAIDFSKGLSNSLEKKLKLRGLSTNDLKNHPDLLEEMVGGEYKRSLLVLQKSKSSGVFIILDATINPTLENARSSKVGLYIKNMEPNILSSSSAYLLFLRGFSSIGRQNSMTLHPQWRMEFDTANAPYFSRPILEATHHQLALSRLYYWNPATTLPGTNEDIMLCSVPLIDSEGQVFGVCGLEVSSMLFKLSHMPENDTYQRIFCVLSPGDDDTLDLSQAFLAGGYTIRNLVKQDQILVVKKNCPFSSYRREDGSLFSGLQKELSFYPTDSVFAGEKWVVAVMMPDQDISAAVIKANIQLILLFSLLLAIGSIISYYLSRRYLKPFVKSIEMIKANDFSEVSKTRIAEIDDLIDFLSSHKEVNTPLIKTTEPLETKLPSAVYHEFVKNTELLSPAERAVFDLYVKGYRAKEITQILKLSINTIKTHNKRIYMKLNVASREELLVYVTMLKEAGKEFHNRDKV